MIKALAYLGAVLCLYALSGASAVAQERQYSGYLKDYSGLEAYEDAKGNTVMRKTDARLNPQNYKAVLLEKVTLYPAPQPTDAVSADTLEGIAEYADAELRDMVGQQVKLVDKAGPGVATLRLAITGAAPEKEGLKPYQYIPVAFVLTTVKRAATGTPRQAKLMIEAEITDSMTGERLLAAVREGKGKTLDGDKVTLESLKPLLSEWMEGAASEIPKFIATK